MRSIWFKIRSGNGLARKGGSAKLGLDLAGPNIATIHLWVVRERGRCSKFSTNFREIPQTFHRISAPFPDAIKRTFREFPQSFRRISANFPQSLTLRSRLTCSKQPGLLLLKHGMHLVEGWPDTEDQSSASCLSCSEAHCNASQLWEIAFKTTS